MSVLHHLTQAMSAPRSWDAWRILHRSQLLYGLLVVLSCLAPVAGGCQFRWGWGLLVLASALLLVIWGWSESPGERRWAPLSWVFVALAALHLLQLVPLPPVLWRNLAPLRAEFLPAQAAAGTWQPLSCHLEATRDNFLVLLACLAAYNFGWRVLSRRTRCIWVGLAWLATAVVLALYGLLILGTTEPTKFLGIGNYSPDRVTGSYTGPNQFAGYLTLVLPLALMGIFGWGGSAETKRHSIWGRLTEGLKRGARGAWVLGLFCLWLVGLVALALTQSRMGIASFILGVFLAYAVVYRRTMRWYAFAGICVALALAVLVGIGFGLDPVLARYAVLFESRAVQEQGVGAVEVRPQIWRDALGLVWDHWLLGAGSGSFRTVYAHYQSPSVGGWAKFAHNDYLNALADLGVAGFLVIMSGLALWFRRIWSFQSGGDYLCQGLLFAAVWGVSAILFHSLTLFNLQEPANAWLFCLLLGAGLGLAGRGEAASDKVRKTEENPRWRRWLRVAGLTGVVAVSALGGFSVMRAEAYWPVDREALWRSRVRGQPEAALREVQTARAWDPLLVEAQVAEARYLVDFAEAERDADSAASRLREAEALLENALALSPLEAATWYEYSRVALGRGNWADARWRIDMAQRAAPSWPIVGLLRGRLELSAWRSAGGPEVRVPPAALEAFRLAAATKSSSVLTEALEALSAAAPWDSGWREIVPECVDGWSTYGRLAAGHEKLREAAFAYEQALNLLPSENLRDELNRAKTRDRLESDLAAAYVGMGEYDVASARMVGVLQRKTVSERALLGPSVWEAARKEGAPMAGLDFARQFSAAFPGEGWGPELEGRALAALELWPEAEAAVRRALELGETAERRNLLADVLSAQGRMDTALAALDRAVLLGPDRPQWRLKLADWLSQKAYHARALQEVDAVEVGWPDLRDQCRALREAILKRRARLLGF